MLPIEAIRFWSIRTICVRTGPARISTNVICSTISYVYRLPLKDLPRRFSDWANERTEGRDRAPSKLLLDAGE